MGIKVTRVVRENSGRSAESAALTKHLRGPVEFKLRAELSDGHEIRATAHWYTRDQAYGLATVTVRESKSESVTSTTLRAIPVNDMLAQCLELWATIGGGIFMIGGQSIADTRRQIACALKGGRPRPNGRVLELVATMYELGQVLGKQPLQVVRAEFNLPQSTASNWIKLAREHGHLDA